MADLGSGIKQVAEETAEVVKEVTEEVKDSLGQTLEQGAQSATGTQLTPQQIQQKQSGQPAKEQPPIPTGAATAGQKKGLGGITGRAISTLTKPSGIAAIIVSILVLGGGYTAYYYLYKKKR